MSCGASPGCAFALVHNEDAACSQGIQGQRGERGPASLAMLLLGRKEVWIRASSRPVILVLGWPVMTLAPEEAQAGSGLQCKLRLCCQVSAWACTPVGSESASYLHGPRASFHICRASHCGLDSCGSPACTCSPHFR